MKRTNHRGNRTNQHNPGGKPKASTARPPQMEPHGTTCTREQGAQTQRSGTDNPIYIICIGIYIYII